MKILVVVMVVLVSLLPQAVGAESLFIPLVVGPRQERVHFQSCQNKFLVIEDEAQFSGFEPMIQVAGITEFEYPTLAAEGEAAILSGLKIEELNWSIAPQLYNSGGRQYHQRIKMGFSNPFLTFDIVDGGLQMSQGDLIYGQSETNIQGWKVTRGVISSGDNTIQYVLLEQADSTLWVGLRNGELCIEGLTPEDPENKGLWAYILNNGQMPPNIEDFVIGRHVPQ